MKGSGEADAQGCCPSTSTSTGSGLTAHTLPPSATTALSAVLVKPDWVGPVIGVASCVTHSVAISHAAAVSAF